MSKTFTRYLTESEEKRLWETMKLQGHILARRDYAWMRLLRQTGIRIGSLAAITVGDAREAIRERRLDLREAKRGKTYSVPVNRAARRALRDLLEIRMQQGHVLYPDAPLIMSRQEGRGLSVRTFQQRMQKWVIAAHLPMRATPHWFRHTLAKRILARSTAANPLGIVQGALGHSSIASTGVYTRPDREEIAEAMEVAS